MDQRYAWFAQKEVKTIDDYHKKYGEQARRDIAYIVVVIDELADLMMTGGQAIERLLVRIAQMARAAGIHLVVATQRPSVDIITGLIKVNFPSRIAFRVTSKTDSRIILDVGGAEQLLGRGDMLFASAQTAHAQRVHGAYVSDEDIARVTAHIRAQQVAHYLELSALTGASAYEDIAVDDETLYRDVLAFLPLTDEVSISLLQRKFRIGFNRSARIIELLEQQGKITATNGGKTRKVVHLQ
jgi:S-DNA-T family DNA segregation ATPase FtsK/SpoIIIE